MNNVECESCIKRQTMFCPNSAECYETQNKPYWQNRIMLLEENKELKEDIKLNESVFVGLLDKTIKYQELIKKVIKIIEDDYYSKNTVDIDSVSIPNNKLIQIREILKGDIDE